MGNTESNGTNAKEAPVIVYSKTTCSYCAKAKTLLKNENIDFTAYELNLMPDGANVAKELKRATGLNYVPQIFICGKLIGGFTELAKLQEEGVLNRMTQECSKSSVGVKVR